MNCKICGFENIKGSNFCAACGTPLIQEETVGIINETKERNDKPFVYPEGSYAYAKILSQTVREYRSGPVPSYYCKCIDDQTTFFLETSFAMKADQMSAGIGDYIWVRLQEKDTKRPNRYRSVRVVLPNAMNPSGAIRHEFHTFCDHFREGDVIMAPIVEDKGNSITVRIGPLLLAKALKPSRFQYAIAAPGQIGRFEITRIANGEKVSVQMKLLSVMTDAGESKEQSVIPCSMQDVYISPNTLAVVAEKDDMGRISQIMGQQLSETVLRDFLEKQYHTESQAKRVVVKEDKFHYYMDFDLGIRDKRNVPLHAGFKKKKNSSRRWEMNLFGFASCQVEKELDRFVYIENMQEVLNDLSEMTLRGENWDHPGERGRKRVLEQYLRCVFYKSRVDNLVVENADTCEAVFNTGLVDGAYDDIYCYLKKNTASTGPYASKWAFGFFACWGKGRDGKYLNNRFGQKPIAPRYIDPDRIQDIYYDADKQLSCDYDHIVRDNLERLPMEFIRRKLSHSALVVEAIDKYSQSRTIENLTALKNLIVSNEDYLRRIVEGLRTAVSAAQKRCRGNYKMAVPVYYPRNNSVSLLLPLCLSEDGTKADAALVVERLAHGNYQGHTILTMQMAYLDARMICRPDSPWLQTAEEDIGMVA